MTINTVTWYRVTNPFKAMYEIEDVEGAILNIINTTLRDVIGSMELDETLGISGKNQLLSSLCFR